MDDLLAALLRSSAHESLLVLILLLSSLAAPISWKKACAACVGLLMWATNISQVLRHYVAPLYRLLNSPPGANVSIAPRMWPAFLHSLDSRAVVAREITGLCPSGPASLKSGTSRSTARPIYRSYLGLHFGPILPTNQDDQCRPAKLALALAAYSGWVSTKRSIAWFAESYNMEDIRHWWPILTKDARNT